MTTRLLVTAAVLSGILSAAALPAAAAPDSVRVPPVATTEATRVIVTWEDGTNGLDRTAALRGVGLPRGARLPLLRGELVETGAGSADVLARRLAAHPAVAYAEADLPLWPSVSDPGFDRQWGLDNDGEPPLATTVDWVEDVDVDAPEAWALATPVTTPVVAVLDTGVDLSHPDLAGAAWVNEDEVPGNGLDDDANGFVDDVSGWDFVHGDATVYDVADGDGHGTHVAGTIGAGVDNGIGVAGVAPDVALMALKILGPDGGNTSDAIKAIAYAQQEGATVLNASWGGDTYNRALEDAIARSGLLFVAAAGNGGADKVGDDATVAPEYPGALQLPNLVSVAAVDASGALAPFSNYGEEHVDVAGPGVSVLSTLPGGAYGSYQGTSMATPHVAGVGALLAAARPDLTGAELADLLSSSAQPLPSLKGKTVTGGLVNAAAALASVAPPAAEPEPEPLPEPAPDPEPSPSTEPLPDPSPSTEPSPPTAPMPETEPLPAPSPPSAPLPPLEACPSTVPVTGFTDVDRTSVHAAQIDCGVWWGLIRGTSADAYGPDRGVTRGQMALFLSRMVATAGLDAPPGASPFADVAGTTYGPAVSALHALGIVAGTSATTYSPERAVDRAQMATFLVRLHERVSGAPLVLSPAPFADTATSVHADSIAKAYAAGLARGVSATEYGPQRTVRRDQMASFLLNEVRLLVRTGRLAPRG